MKVYFKTTNEGFFPIEILPEDTTEQVIHKIQDRGESKSRKFKDKGGIKSCSSFEGQIFERCGFSTSCG